MKVLNKANRQYYEEQPERFRGTPKGLLTDDDMHHNRLVAQVGLVDFLIENVKSNPIRILDVGCGYGDLLTYLKKFDIFSKLPSKDFHYTGLEQVEWVYNVAKDRHPTADIRYTSLHDFISSLLRRGKDFEKYDIVLAMGLIATMNVFEVHSLVSEIEMVSRKWVCFSGPVEGVYKGSLNSFSAEDIQRIFGDNFTFSSVNGNAIYWQGFKEIVK